MRVRITGVDPQKTIVAIKGIRSVTGIGLKEAKDVVDNVRAGTPQTIIVRDDADLRYLDQHHVTYRVEVPLAELIAALSDYPAGMRVGDLVRTLSVAKGQS